MIYIILMKHVTHHIYVINILTYQIKGLEYALKYYLKTVYVGKHVSFNFILL